MTAAADCQAAVRISHVQASGGGLFAFSIARVTNRASESDLHKAGVGRPTAVPWGMIVTGDSIPRHPSQLYEALLRCRLCVLPHLSRRMSNIKQPIFRHTPAGI